MFDGIKVFENDGIYSIEVCPEAFAIIKQAIQELDPNRVALTRVYNELCRAIKIDRRSDNQ